MLPFLVPVLFTFYIQGVLKKLKKFGCQKVNEAEARWNKREGNRLALNINCRQEFTV
jgi:hypothetical protein